VSGPEIIPLDTPGWSNPSLPVLRYRGGVPVADPAAVEAMLGSNAWPPRWRNGVYPFHHFHSTAHEALACVSGSATLRLGGPDGLDVRIEAGDLLVLPAGTGHRRVEASAHFLLVGAYPEGQDWDVRREAARAADKARIAVVPMPAADPVHGSCGPLAHLWSTVK
jgi:uncharacterized protein YjlB